MWRGVLLAKKRARTTALRVRVCAAGRMEEMEREGGLGEAVLLLEMFMMQQRCPSMRWRSKQD